MASTNEYLAEAVREDRRKLGHALRELSTTVGILVDRYDPGKDLVGQDDLLEHFGDMVEFCTEIGHRVVVISALEEVPCVG